MFWANRVPSFADSGRFGCGVASFGLMSPLLSAARMKAEGKKEGASRGSFLLELLLPRAFRFRAAVFCIAMCSVAASIAIVARFFWPRSPRRQTCAKRPQTSVHAFCVLQTLLPPPLANGLRAYEPDNSSFVEHARNEAICWARQCAERGKALNVVTGLVETAFESFAVISD